MNWPAQCYSNGCDQNQLVAADCHSKRSEESACGEAETLTCTCAARQSRCKCRFRVTNRISRIWSHPIQMSRRYGTSEIIPLPSIRHKTVLNGGYFAALALRFRKARLAVTTNKIIVLTQMSTMRCHKNVNDLLIELLFAFIVLTPLRRSTILKVRVKRRIPDELPGSARRDSLEGGLASSTV